MPSKMNRLFNIKLGTYCRYIKPRKGLNAMANGCWIGLRLVGGLGTIHLLYLIDYDQ